MSIRKYKNPVNNHFIYNDETRKSTCQICYFDMAGRHSENLMRHLNRKHPTTYAEVLLEKQRRRAACQNLTGSLADPTGPTYTTKLQTRTRTRNSNAEPHNVFIKSEKLSFRVDIPGQQQITIPDTLSNEFDDDDDDSMGNGQFESVYLAKAELREGQLNDSNESLSYQESHPEENEFIISNLSPQASAASTTIVSGAATTTVATPNATSSGTSTVAPICSPNPDDAFFLQYLGNKFSKYSENTKNTVQFHINRILYKADMGCYENADASKINEPDT